MAALFRTVSRLRRSPLVAFSCDAAAAIESFHCRRVKATTAVVAAGATTTWFQAPRASLPNLSIWDATKSFRMFCNTSGNNCQALWINELLQEVQKSLEESGERDVVLLNSVQALLAQKTLQVSEDQGYVIIALLHMILAREVEKAEVKTEEEAEVKTEEEAKVEKVVKASEVVVLTAQHRNDTLYHGYMLYGKYARHAQATLEGEDKVMLEGVLQLLYDEDFKVFCIDIFLLSRQLLGKVVSGTRHEGMKLRSVVVKLRNGAMVTVISTYVALISVLSLLSIWL